MSTVVGEISFSNTANLEKKEGTYKIKWSSNLIFPSLNDNYKVRVSTIDAKTGEILALVSTPTFNSNDFSLGITVNKWDELLNDEAKPLYNRTTLASY